LGPSATRYLECVADAVIGEPTVVERAVLIPTPPVDRSQIDTPAFRLTRSSQLSKTPVTTVRPLVCHPLGL
jgi:hypothetical protein